MNFLVEDVAEEGYQLGSYDSRLLLRRLIWWRGF